MKDPPGEGPRTTLKTPARLARSVRAALLAVLLVGAAALTGCAEAPLVPASVGDPAELLDAPRPELVVPVPLPPVLVGDPGGGAEPNIAVAPDGTLFVASPLAVWRSADHGATWTQAKAKGLTGGGDGDIAFDANGTLYWLGLGGEDGPIPFQTSTDGGETWSKAVDVSDGTGFDREWLDVTASGKVYTTWRGEEGLEFNFSPDGGATWRGKTVAGPDGDQGPVTHDRVSGRLYVPVVDLGPLAGLEKPHVRVHTSDDDGATWTAHDLGELPRTMPVEPNGYNSDFPVITVDDAGTAYLVYSADNSPTPGVTPPEALGIFGIWLQVSTDGGETWSERRLLSDPTKAARMPWAAAGAPGRLAVAWYENVHGVPGEVVPDQWNVMLWESVTADAAEPAAVTVMLTPEPNHVGGLCTAGVTCLALDRSLLDFFEIALDLEGQPVAAWASSKIGTGIGIAVEATMVRFGGVAEGTPLR